MKQLFAAAALVLLVASNCTDHDKRSPSPSVEMGRREVIRSVDGKTVRAVLEIEPPVSEVGGEITWTLHNRGDALIWYGRAYDVERRTGASWTDVPSHGSFTLDLPGLRAGDSTDPVRVAVDDKRGDPVPLEPGTYRFVLRDVHLGSLKRADLVRITAEFRVVSADS